MTFLQRFRGFFTLSYSTMSDDPEMSNHTLGYYLSRVKQHATVLWTMKRYLWPKNRIDLRLRVVLSLLCLLMSKVVGVLTPFTYKAVIDNLSNGSDFTSSILVFVLLYGLGSLMSVVFSNLRDALFVKVTQNARKTASLETFNHLHALSLSFHLKRNTGSVTRGIDRGTRGIQMAVSFTLFNILPIILELTFVCGILLVRYMVWISLITFACVVFYITFTISVTEWRTKFRRSMNAQENKASNKAIDSLLNYETVKYFNNEHHESSRYEVALDGYVTAATKAQWSLAFLNIGQSFIISFGQFIVMLITAYEVYNGRMSTGDLVLINTFLLQLYQPLSFLGSSFRMLKQSLVDIESMFDLLKEPVEIEDPARPVHFEVPEGRVEFRNVRFSYDPENVDPDADIIKDVSFTVEPQKMVALVGPSGSGKSTLLRLLFRFYDAREGEILIDGVNIKDVKQTDLREHIGIIPQDNVLFNDSIRYNIAYGRQGLHVSDEEVEEAAEAAQLSPLIDRLTRLADGYESQVGERGLQVSGGERQRIAIARCLLKHCEIICEDESTSSLDAGAEKEIQKQMDKLFKGRKTTIVIAHRLSAVLNADEILVLKEGSIVERGTHEELLAKEGEYHYLWTQQSQKQEDEGEKKEEKTPKPAKQRAAPRGHGHGHGHGF